MKQAFIIRIRGRIQQDGAAFQLQGVDQSRFHAVQGQGADPFGPVGGQTALAASRGSIERQDRTHAVRPGRQHPRRLGVAVRDDEGVAHGAFQRQTQLFGGLWAKGARRGHGSVIAEARSACVRAGLLVMGRDVRPCGAFQANSARTGFSLPALNSVTL